MKQTFILLFCMLVSLGATAQDFDAEIFKADIVSLYDVGKSSFKSLKEGDSFETVNGEYHYKSSLLLNGSESVYISEDAEKSHTYIAQYTFKNVRDPQAKMMEFVNLIAEATSDHELVVGRGTDIKYLGYQKQTIEFPADNIDDMGKHPSFTVGMLEDGNPMSFEIQVSEILWK
jgi:hypothetical protein